jgi:hypothetical protein
MRGSILARTAAVQPFPTRPISTRYRLYSNTVIACALAKPIQRTSFVLVSDASINKSHSGKRCVSGTGHAGME